MTSTGSINNHSQSSSVNQSTNNESASTDSDQPATDEAMSLQTFNELKRDGEKEGLDYYQSEADNVKAVFSNLENTREYIDVDGDNAIIDTGRGDDAAYLSGDNNSVTFGNGSDVGGTFGKNGFVMGESGSDVLYAMGEHSAAYGGTGNDYVQVSGQSAVGYGGEGEDRIVTRGNGAYGFGGLDNDMLIAEGTNGFIAGEQGDDKLILAGLDNTAEGGEGNDKLALLSRGKADGGVGDDSFLLSQSAMGSEIIGGEGDDSVFLNIPFDSDLWVAEFPDLGNEGESSITINGQKTTLEGIESVYFNDGRSIKYDGVKWGISEEAAPPAPDTLVLNSLERVPEGHLESENSDLSEFNTDSNSDTNNTDEAQASAATDSEASEAIEATDNQGGVEANSFDGSTMQTSTFDVPFTSDSVNIRPDPNKGAGYFTVTSADLSYSITNINRLVFLDGIFAILTDDNTWEFKPESV